MYMAVYVIYTIQACMGVETLFEAGVEQVYYATTKVNIENDRDDIFPSGCDLIMKSS